MAASSGSVDFDTMPEPQQPSGGAKSWGSTDVLSRLRLPGQVPPQAPAPAEPHAEPAPTAAINKRGPVGGVRLPNIDPAAVALGNAAVNYGLPAGSGPVRPPQSRPMTVESGSSPQRPPNGRPDEGGEVAQLRTENKELRQLLGEMKHLLQEASDTEQRFATRDQELQAALAEKQRQIDALSGQLQAIEEQIASGELSQSQPVAVPKTRGEVEEWADELEKENSRLAQERKRLAADRQQLREDEEALEKQMRDMEVSMARERALMARQETELKRLSAEIQHELEMMQRGDASLREQMTKFQRRAQDVMQGKVDPRASQQSSLNLGGFQPPPRR
jgi:predicted  nucleic acid-binding Zn-ribbon protein